MKVVFVLPDMRWLYDYKSQFSLGILNLSTVLKSKGCEVEVFDTNIKSIMDIPYASVYAFSAVHYTYKNCIDIATQIKIMFPECKYIVGGPHATTSREDLLCFDSVFIGEAEDTISEFVDDYHNNNCKKIYESSKEVNLDNIIPDRSILTDDYIRTPSIFAKNKVYDDNGCTSIMFSRGCPYQCAFCAAHGLYKNKIRLRGIQSIVSEIKSIIENYNIRQFRVQDDTFTINPTYFKSLADELEPLNIFYRASTRVNLVNEDVVNDLYRSGCREVGIGVEVVDDDVLKKMKKGITIAQVEKAIELFRNKGIITRCFFMIGLPFDSYKTVNDAIDFLERNNIQHAQPSNFVPFPGTEMYDKQKEFNIKAIKQNTQLNISSHLKLEPNILRYDIPEDEHIKIMKVFYDYFLKKGFIK